MHRITCLLVSVAACSAHGAPSSVACSDGAVAVTGGCVRGDHGAFRGIPYAAPPVGALRWKPPAPVVPWTGTRDAITFGKSCPQLDDTIGGKLDTAEDCLTLNVWSPKVDTKAKLPVMVWIHGGGLVQGGSAVSAYDGQHLAADGNVVVVSINYRLGPLGFLSHPALSAEDTKHHASGNYGVMDQLAALDWVRANVAAFGGDAANVTIFGESAGGESTCALMASPLANGLFAKAIIESAQCVPIGRAMRDLRGDAHGESAEAQGMRLGKLFGCDDAACLRDVPVDKLVHASPAGVGFFGKGEHYTFALDNVVFTRTPRDLLDRHELADVPTLIGTTADEATLFTLKLPVQREAAYEATVKRLLGDKAPTVLATYTARTHGTPKRAFDALVTDMVFTCPTRHAARELRARQHHVYRYLFAHVTEHAKYKAMGATHGTEIPYVFGTVGPTATEAERTLSRTMLGYWTRFARTGDPNGGDAPKWPAYDAASDAYLELQTPIAARDHLRATECDLVDTIGPPSDGD